MQTLLGWQNILRASPSGLPVDEFQFEKLMLSRASEGNRTVIFSIADACQSVQIPTQYSNVYRAFGLIDSSRPGIGPKTVHPATVGMVTQGWSQCPGSFRVHVKRQVVVAFSWGVAQFLVVRRLHIIFMSTEFLKQIYNDVKHLFPDGAVEVLVARPAILSSEPGPIDPAVRLVHTRTGTEASCGEFPSQIENYITAAVRLRIACDKHAA